MNNTNPERHKYLPMAVDDLWLMLKNPIIELKTHNRSPAIITRHNIAYIKHFSL